MDDLTACRESRSGFFTSASGRIHESRVFRNLVAGDPDEARNSDRHARALELLHPVLELAIGDGHALAQTDIFSPRCDDEALDKPSFLLEVLEDTPARRSVAASRSLGRMRRVQKRFAALRRNLVLDLNEYGSVIG